MPIGTKTFFSSFLLVMFIVFCAGSGAIAQDSTWRVGKSSGEVWVTSGAVQQTSITSETMLKPGDYIRTGQNGRVLLVRGAETMLISPNSIVNIPKDNRDGMSTTIIQRSGAVLFEVEKRNVKHFEVATPYLAAVVKGTQFQVTINRNETRVDVMRGEVEVSEFKSGQYALVQPNQVARVSTQGSAGLSLTGSGTLSSIRQGTPRISPVDAMPADELAANGAAEPQSQSQQGRAAAPLADSQSLFTPPAGVSPTKVARAEGTARENSMASRPTASGHVSSSPSRLEDLAFELSFPFAAGIFVAIAVASKRRWQKRKRA